MRALRLAALVLCLAGSAAAEDATINYADNDATMEAAIADARATLPIFLRNALDAKGVSLDDALVKVALPTEPGSPTSDEHIWVAPFARLQDGSFSGLLANEPVNLGPLRAGDRIDFTEDMISDWHFNAPTGRYWGSYTSRVMYDAGAFGDTPFDRIFEADPVPPDWR
jgi:uncharacterized protein YegJ (DUF2314 family)